MKIPRRYGFIVLLPLVGAALMQTAHALGSAEAGSGHHDPAAPVLIALTIVIMVIATTLVTPPLLKLSILGFARRTRLSAP